MNYTIQMNIVFKGNLVTFLLSLKCRLKHFVFIKVLISIGKQIKEIFTCKHLYVK